jgi:CheY-like chemotaxis protein
MRFALLLRSFLIPLALSIPISASVPVSAHAQLFGGVDEQAEATPSPEAEPTEPDELVRQLESTASRGGQYRASAIASLIRLGAWEAADRWLAELDSVEDQQELAEAARVIGPQLLLRVSLRSELSDPSRSAIRKMATASQSLRESPQRLAAAIEQLGRADVNEQLAAGRTLLQGGHASVQAVVDALVTGQADRPRSELLSILRSLGPGGAQALEQLALYGNASVRGAALDTLARLDREAADDALLTAALASDATARERRVAEQALPQASQVTRQQAIAALARRLDALRAIARRTPNDASPVTLWSVDQERSGVVPNRSSEIYLRYRRGYDAAQRLRRLGELPEEVLRSVLAADLAYRVMVDPDWGDAPQVQAVADAYGARLTTKLLAETLAEERRPGRIPATLGLLRMIQGRPQSDADVDVLLDSYQGKPGALVQAVRAPEPRIRYEAAATIRQALAQAPESFAFAGSTSYRRTLSEMASLKPNPTAILVETRPVVALRQETILGQLGYQVRVVRSGLAAEREIHRGGDLRLVLSKVTVADMRARELVDRIRRHPKGRHLPIVLYQDEDSEPGTVAAAELEMTSERWTSEGAPAVDVVALPGSPAALTETLAEVRLRRRLPPLSAGDRSQFRQIGITALQGESSPR